MLCAFENRNQSLRLRRLRRLIDQNLFKLKIPKPPIESGDTGRADNVGIFKNFVFSLFLEVFQLLLLFFVELSIVFFLLYQPLHLLKLTFRKLFDLFVEAEEAD